MDKPETQNVNEPNLRRIKEHLQKRDAQERIQKRIQDAHSKATVTISQAARLFGFSENQLRDWEKRFGLLKTERPFITAKEEGKSTSGHRQYSPSELNKLAIIKELIDEGDFAPGDIPTNIFDIWYSIHTPNELQAHLKEQDQVLRFGGSKTEFLPINQRIENARAELFLRYFASHALRLSLMLICDELPGSAAGLVLPLDPDPTLSVRRIEDLSKVGESLVGWLSQSRSSHTFITAVPSFEYSSDYSLLPLAVMKANEPREQPKDNTLIILDRLDRRSKSLSLSAPIVETLRSLLAPLYEDAQNLRACFGPGMRDELDPAPNLDSSAYIDIILDGLADIVVRLGGRTDEGQDCWRFCCILLPKDPMLPVQQHTLVVRAQSQHSPHKVGGTTVSPDKFVNSLSLRAYQSGRVIYRAKISATDSTIAHREVEGPVRSAVAVPIGGESGQAVAVLYVVSDETEAFPESGQRVLRMLGRMVEEALLTYRVRQQVTLKLTNAMDYPRSVDPLFEVFLSENEFIRDVEELLSTIKIRIENKRGRTHQVNELPPSAQYKTGSSSEEVVSFIAIDVDYQSSLANKYGDLMTRNLSREVGRRIQGQIRALFKEIPDCQLYHIYSDRFYIILRSMPLEQAREKAERLRQGLRGSYQIDALRTSIEQPTLPGGMLSLPDITVRLGVTSYPYQKLEEILLRYPTATSEVEVRGIISTSLDEALVIGRDQGGDVVIAWNPEIWGFAPWSPSKIKEAL